MALSHSSSEKGIRKAASAIIRRRGQSICYSISVTKYGYSSPLKILCCICMAMLVQKMAVTSAFQCPSNNLMLFSRRSSRMLQRAIAIRPTFYMTSDEKQQLNLTPTSPTILADSSSQGLFSRRNIVKKVIFSGLVYSTFSSPPPPQHHTIPAANAAILSSGETTTTGMNTVKAGGRIRYGSENEIMSPKQHGTTLTPVQNNLRYGVSSELADRICCYNRHFAEPSGYFEKKESTFREVVTKKEADAPITFYDSVSGKPVFIAPIGRSTAEFLQESSTHGWPSFRDEEVVWDNVRVLRNSGETVSLAGTHLGHNLPDKKGNRFCIDLVSISGNPIP